MNDRIKLAEAMGWKSTGTPDGDILWAMPDSAGNYPDGYCFETCELPDPFTDANDDYAVLEWMRSDINAWRYQYRKELMLTNNEVGVYEIGDYARAALKVIDDD